MRGSTDLRYSPVDGERSTDDQPTPTLYEWAGGYEAFETLVKRFYELVLADDVLYPLFKDMDHDHPKHVAVWLSEVFGGPGGYTREHGGYDNMIAHHVGKAITETDCRRAALRVGVGPIRELEAVALVERDDALR